MSVIPTYVPANERTAVVTPSLVPAAPVRQYVSVFDDPDRFEHCYRMADILSKSLFVPGGSRNNPDESFRNNPANCLLALDLAGRLDLAPTSLFPHLYVINGRPALSAQFVIALVNRSGRFSRICWKEGIDGEVVYEAYGKPRSVPNYYAEASFTELATGFTYTSTRVSVEVAKRAGWLTKNESKWQSLPQEMCRWRSAAWLCKNYAPELILGLEFEDEVRDADAVAPVDVNPMPAMNPRTVLPRGAAAYLGAPAETQDDGLETLYSGEIRDAKTLEELSKVGDAISRADLDKDAKQRLRDAFKQRRGELMSSVPAVVPAAKIETKTTPKRTRKTAPKPEPVQEPSTGENALVEAIQNASNFDQLKAVQAAVEATIQNGQADEASAQALLDAIEMRAQELEDGEEQAVYEEEAESDFADVEEPTERQISNASTLHKNIVTAGDLTSIRQAIDAVTKAVNDGSITKAQGIELFKVADKTGGNFLV